MPMARDKRDLERLAEELAGLTPEERSRVLAGVTRRDRLRPLPADFRFPVFARSDGRWIGGSLRREDLHGDDER